jgi:hypothetical protein
MSQNKFEEFLDKEVVFTLNGYQYFQTNIRTIVVSILLSKLLLLVIIKLIRLIILTTTH